MADHVDVILTTWARFESRVRYLRAALESLRLRLKTSDCVLHYVIGAEGLDAPYQNDVRKLCSEYGATLVVNNGPPNLGRNLNNLHSNTSSPWVLYVQDDFVLMEDFDLDYDVAVMKQHKGIDMIRYEWRKISRSNLKQAKEDATIWYLSPSEPRFYSDNPHLRRRSWMDRTGLYITTDNAACENGMNSKAKSLRMGVFLKKERLFRHGGLETVMWEKWAAHPKGWAAQLLISPEDAKRYHPGWRISWELADFLAEHLKTYLPRTILETGPGMSSILFYQYAGLVPEVKYFSVDHQSKFHGGFLTHMKEKGFDVSNAFIVPWEEGKFYDLGIHPDAFFPRQKFDLIFFDGPPDGRGTKEAIKFVKDHTGPGTCIIVDDTHREHELRVIEIAKKWYPKDHFEVVTLKANDRRDFRVSTALVPKLRFR